MLGCPWTFDRQAIVLKAVDDGCRPAEMKLNLMPIWVQVLGLPLLRLSADVLKDVGEKVGGKIGFVLEVEGCERNVGIGKYLRIRVLIDVSKPICRGSRMAVGDGDPFCLSFQYERLPHICYVCGVFEHTEKDCHLYFQAREAGRKVEYGFGDWLRVTPQGRRSPSKGHVSEVSSKLGSESKLLHEDDRTGGDGAAMATEEASSTEGKQRRLQKVPTISHELSKPPSSVNKPKALVGVKDHGDQVVDVLDLGGDHIGSGPEKFELGNPKISMNVEERRLKTWKKYARRSHKFYNMENKIGPMMGEKRKLCTQGDPSLTKKGRHATPLNEIDTNREFNLSVEPGIQARRQA